MPKNTVKIVLIICISIFCAGIAAEADSLKYYHAAEFQIIGRGFDDTQTPFERLPAGLEGKTRTPVWDLSKNCAGLAVRFRTNSPVIAVKWEVTGDVTMNHFAPTGIKGLDLYGLQEGKWRFVNTARPVKKVTSSIIIDNRLEEESEFMLYLPLYDGLSSLEIGVKSTALISSPLADSPHRNKPVVFYGTSITQGGCASRPGMAYPAQLSRMLDRQTINLGFSGNGQLDYEIAEAMAGIDASCFVIDCLPNVTVAQMNEKYIRFLEILRAGKPDTPILLVDNILFPHIFFDLSVKKKVEEKNRLLQQIFKEMKKRGDRHLYYVEADGLIGSDGEGTVDGVHLTDLGFQRISENLFPVIRKLIK